jgi:phage terminase small subunit
LCLWPSAHSYSEVSEVSRASVRRALLAQLEAMGADQDHFVDLVKDYISLYDVKNKLIKDIKQRGVMYVDVNSVGAEMQKNNPSVRELVNVNRQMLALLRELGISTDTVPPREDDDEM